MQWQRIKEKIKAIAIGDKIREAIKRSPVLTYFSLVVLGWIISIAIVMCWGTHKVVHFLALFNGMIDGVIVGGALCFVFAKFFENFTRYAIGAVGAGSSYGVYDNWGTIQTKIKTEGFIGLIPSFFLSAFRQTCQAGH